MRAILLLSVLLAATLAVPGAVAGTSSASTAPACLFGYNPDAVANVCSATGSYQEPAYVYEVALDCLIPVIGNLCVYTVSFDPLYQRGWYDVPYVAVYGDTYCLWADEETDAPDRTDDAPARCSYQASTQPATAAVFDAAPL